MIAIIGLLTVGIMIGLAISDHNTSNMEYVNSLAAWAQVITGGCTLYLAYLGFTQWKIQLHREFNFEVRHSPMPPDGTLRIP